MSVFVHTERLNKIRQNLVFLNVQKQTTDQLLICNIEMSQTICDKVKELAYYVLQFVKKKMPGHQILGKRKHTDIKIIL